MVAHSKYVQAHSYVLAGVGVAALVALHPSIKEIPALLEHNTDSSSSAPLAEQKLAAIALVYVYHMVVATILKELKLPLPSSLTSMLLVYAKLQALEFFAGTETAERVAAYFDPAVNFLGRWMAAWLAPPLVVLPNAVADVKGANAGTWGKLAGLHFGLWVLTLVGSGALSRLLQRAQKSTSSKEHDAQPKSTNTVAVPSSKPDFDRLLKLWSILTAGSLGLVPLIGEQPVLLSATITGLCLGQKLPSNVKTIIHPLVVASFIAGVLSYILKWNGNASTTLQEALSAYFTKQGISNPEFGAGDVLFELLAPSCTVLGFRMFGTRHLLAQNLVPLLGSIFVSSIGSLFISPYLGKMLNLPPELSLMLSQRSVMSSLAIPCSGLIGASTAIAVASILITGVYGASIGQEVLSSIGIDASEVIARGVALGTSSHSIGTASLMAMEPDAAAIASVSMCLAGVFHTMACSLPPVVKLLRSAAGFV